MRYAIALLLSLAATLSWAQERVGALPAGASQLLVRGETYFYTAGSFYRRVDGGYVRVDPPLGARVPYAPGSAGTFLMGGERYFVTRGGSFLRYEPSGDDFTVVAPPYGWRDYYSGAPGIESLPAPRLAAQAPPIVSQPRAVPRVIPREIPRAYPAPSPGYRAYGSGGYYADYYGGLRGDEYYGRYGFRDDIYDENLRERRETCRRIARDQSRRADVGPYRRQPGSYHDEYRRCMR